MFKVESKKCPHCEAPIEKITDTCKFCGADVMVAVEEYQEPQEHTHKASEDSSVCGITNTCKICGAKVEEDIPKGAKIQKVKNTCKFCGSDVMTAIQEYQEP